MIQWIGGIPFLVGALGGILTSVWSDSMIKRGRSALSARKVMLMAVVVVAPLCAAVPYVGASETLSFAWRVGLVVAIFSLVAVMCLSWLYTLPVVLARDLPDQERGQRDGHLLRCGRTGQRGVQPVRRVDPSRSVVYALRDHGYAPHHRSRRVVEDGASRVAGAK